VTSAEHRYTLRGIALCHGPPIVCWITPVGKTFPLPRLFRRFRRDCRRKVSRRRTQDPSDAGHRPCDQPRARQGCTRLPC
jgi:hypothetical protein